MSSPAAKSPYAGHRFPAGVMSHPVRLCLHFPLGLRMAEEVPAAWGIVVSHEAVRRWALKFGQTFADRIRRRLARAGDKWHLDEVALPRDSSAASSSRSTAVSVTRYLFIARLTAQAPIAGSQNARSLESAVAEH